VRPEPILTHERFGAVEGSALAFAADAVDRRIFVAHDLGDIGPGLLVREAAEGNQNLCRTRGHTDASLDGVGRATEALEHVVDSLEAVERSTAATASSLRT